jgi:hypothetical protein
VSSDFVFRAEVHDPVSSDLLFRCREKLLKGLVPMQKVPIKMQKVPRKGAEVVGAGADGALSTGRKYIIQCP